MSDATATEEVAKQADSDDPSPFDQWYDLASKIKDRQDAVGSEATLAKLRDAKGVRAEMRDWIYDFLLKTTVVGGAAAQEIEDLGGEIDELREELGRLGNLTRAIASTNFFALVQRLVMLVQERVQDPETLSAANVVAMLFTSAAPPQVAQPEAAPTQSP